MRSRCIILNSLNDSRELNNLISKMHPSDLQADLKQEIMLVACEMDEQRLIDYDSRNVLIFYMVRVVLNMVHSHTSAFYKKYRKEFLEFNDKMEVADEDYHESKELNLDEIFGTTNAELHEKDMLSTCAINYNNNAKKLSRDCGIPYKTVLRTLKAAKNKVICKF